MFKSNAFALARHYTRSSPLRVGSNRTGRLFALSLLVASQALAGCVIISDDCEVQTYPDQCASPAQFAAALHEVSNGTAVSPSTCPSTELLYHYLIKGYELDLEGGQFVQGPTLVNGNCCYTTRSVPCE